NSGTSSRRQGGLRQVVRTIPCGGARAGRDLSAEHQVRRENVGRTGRSHRLDARNSRVFRSQWGGLDAVVSSDGTERHASRRDRLLSVCAACAARRPCDAACRADAGDMGWGALISRRTLLNWSAAPSIVVSATDYAHMAHVPEWFYAVLVDRRYALATLGDAPCRRVYSF